MTAPPPITRHFGMDWLRIGAFGLLILYHVGMVFVPWEWHVKTEQPWDWLVHPMLALNPWRLSLLFLVSGFASRALLTKPDITLSGFLRRRSIRLLLPLLAGVFLFVPPQPWAELRIKTDYDRGFWMFWFEDYFQFGVLDGIFLPTYNHLWFVLYLFAYTAILAGVTMLLPAALRASLARSFDMVLGGEVRWLLLPILYLVGVLFWLHPHGELGPQIFLGDWYRHVVFFAMFIIGFGLAGSPKVWMAVRQGWVSAFVLGVLGYGIATILAFTGIGDAVPPALRFWLIKVAQAVQAWGMIAGLIGLADRYWNTAGALRHYLSQGVFPFYIIHQTLIVLSAYAAIAFGLSAPMQLMAALAATILGCWLFYALARRSGPVRPFVGLQ